MNIYEELKKFSKPLVKTEENILSKEFFLDKDFAFYKGHFPENPVLPGIVQLMLFRITLEEAFSHEIDFNDIKVIKFVDVVTCDCTVKTVLTPKTGTKWELTLYKINEDEEIIVTKASISLPEIKGDSNA